MNSTVYDVQVRYGLDDKASRGLEQLGQKASSAEKSVGGLKEALETVAGVFLVGEAFHKGKELFIDLNSEMEQMKINMGAITSFNLGIPFEQASESTDKLIAGWQQFSKSTVLTTQQLVQFGSAIEGAVFQAGGAMKDVDALTKRGAVVMNVLGAGHAGGLQYAQMELREALMGNLRKTQMSNQQLLGPTMKAMGLEVEKFNQLASTQRMAIIQKALNDPAWDAAIQKQRDSWSGVTSTLKDNIEIAAREIGLPLFKEMTAEVGKWNKWLDDHPKEIEDFSKKFTAGLIEGFKTVKAIGAFLVENKDTLLKIAEIWAGSKLATGVFGTAQSIFGTMAGFGTQLGATTTALTAFYIGLQSIADYVDKMHKAEVDKEGEKLALIAGFKTAAGAHDDRRRLFEYSFQRAREAGAVTETGNLNEAKFLAMMSGLGMTAAEASPLYSRAYLSWDQKAAFNKMHPDLLSLGDMRGPYMDEKDRKTKAPANVNVTIHKIEVPAADPDRFVHSLVNKFTEVAKNPVAAESQFRGGY